MIVPVSVAAVKRKGFQKFPTFGHFLISPQDVVRIECKKGRLQIKGYERNASGHPGTIPRQED